MKPIGKNKSKRKSSVFNQAAIARETGYSKSWINKIIKGTKYSNKAMSKIITVVSLQVSELTNKHNVAA